jgi:hypothetical protein
MNEEGNQVVVATSRRLKIETSGDKFLRNIKPKIRITGRWLERAGFKPGHHVEVRVAEQGSISLHFIETQGYTGR